MNLFRRPIPVSDRQHDHDPRIVDRQAPDRTRFAFLPRKPDGGGSLPVRTAGEAQRSRENSRNGSAFGADKRAFGRWFNQSNAADAEHQSSSQASVRSKKSYVDQSTGSPVPATLGSISSTSSSPSFASTPTFSPLFSPNLSATTQDSDSRPLAKKATAKTLASRLQELAIANADGLLDDDEYRLLRQQVFESHTGRDKGPRQNEASGAKLSEHAIIDPVAQHETRDNGPVSTRSPPLVSPRSLLSPELVQTRPPSISSQQSKRHSLLPPITSLFRRDTSASRHIEEEGNEATWRLSSASSLSRSPTVERPADDSSVLADHRDCRHLSPPTSPVRNRAIRNHPGLASSALDGRQPVRYTGSSRSSNGRSTPGGDGSESLLSGSGRSNGYSPRSPTSLRTRSTLGTGVSSALSYGRSSTHSQERSSGLDTALSRTLPPVASSTDPFLFAATDREPSVEELEKEIREIEDEWTRMRDNWKEIVRNKTRLWEIEVGADIAQDARARARFSSSRSEVGTLDPGRAEQKDGASGKRKMFKRASFLPSTRATLPISSATVPADDPGLPTFLLSTEAPLPPDFEARLCSPPLLDATHTLRASMEQVLERQRRTEDKYEKRLQFLKAKERGARIKLGLLK
ncbi:uncharacterized protein JCM15063_004740 [Sporobolomyces koalae]|uniref:uncharacterized protein n=1 Tax=Sporobolomyces koalae TaxID=500713 RepID=UPI00316CABE5